mgnify:CR=1 FL=1|jgi:uncharacterized membrane protein
MTHLFIKWLHPLGAAVLLGTGTKRYLFVARHFICHN